ncbi:MAG: acylphosphatase [Chitinophagales bacterium]
MKRLHLIVKGTVQGVGFRKATLRVAEVLQLRGFVRNLPDGSVEVEAEGEEDKVHKLVDFCHHGPAGATVENVSVNFGGTEKFDHFEIR